MITFVVATPTAALSLWPHSPFENVPARATAADEIPQCFISDGEGGAILIYLDGPHSGPYGVEAQRIAQDGHFVWPTDGVYLGSGGSHAEAVEDGSDGAIVVWQRSDTVVSSAVYAQRLSHSGARMWSPNGICITPVQYRAGSGVVASDGMGGAVVLWSDDRNRDPLNGGGSMDMFAQRIDADGVSHWAQDGAVACSGLNDELPLGVVMNSNGETLILWSNGGGGTLRVQKMSATGERMWGENGRPVSSTIAVSPSVAVDASGALLVSWYSFHWGVATALAQKVTFDGCNWGADGIVLGNATCSFCGMGIAPDGNGGAVVAWSPMTATGHDGVAVQNISPTGVLQWGDSGVVICNRDGDQVVRTVRAHPEGGAVVVWDDLSGNGIDIFAQRVSSDGNCRWSLPGAAICLASGDQQKALVSIDDSGNSLFVWPDTRNGYGEDIYTQWIDSAGEWMQSQPRIVAVRDVAGDQGGKVRIAWHASNLDHTPVGLAQYGIWRRVDASRDAKELRPLADILEAKPGAFRMTTRGAVVQYWEGVTCILARGNAEYSFTAWTFQDSVAAANPYSTFMIDFHTARWPEYWSSVPDSGYSVDNLAPAPPANVHLENGNVLRWDMSVEADFHHYCIYGAPVPRLDASCTTLGQTTNNSFCLGAGAANPQYVLVTAVDDHGNASAAAVRAAVSAVFVPVVARLYPCQPNPFNPRATIRYDLPEAGPVRLAVFDLAGRLVRTLVDESKSQGSFEAVWDGRDAAGREVGSGTYLARLEFGGAVQAVRMGLVR